MAISLANLHKVKPDRPPLLVIYGGPGMGKTSLAASFPNPVFIQTEDGRVEGIELPSFTDGEIQSFTEVIEAISLLYSEDHDHKTLVLDSLDKLEPLLWQATCQRNDWTSIEQAGYGKGYVEADAEWRDLLDGLKSLRTDRNMNIVLIGHSDIGRFDDPASVSYSRYDFRLHKRGHAIVEDTADAVLFVHQDAVIKTEEQGFNKKRNRAEGFSRWIHTEPRPAWNAKNRYGMPERLLYEKGKGYAALAPYLPAQQPLNTAKKAA